MISFLTYAVILLGIIAVAQLIKVFELTGELKGRDEATVSEKDNETQANLYLLFGIGLFVFYGWLLVEYGDSMIPNASEHGAAYDNLLFFNFAIVNLIFILVNAVLFYFAWKYRRNVNRTPAYFTHSNKLEMVWTIVPSIVLAVIIIYGLSIWNQVMMTPPSQDAINVELYSKQFDWTARFSGKDNILGNASVRLIEGANFVGVDPKDNNSKDDIIVKGEFHLPVNKEVNFYFRSQDVLHSAYMPHFRAQINTVPGMVTNFHFIPNKTTAQIREELGDPKYDYVLLCNKICGASHYNMQMTIIVDSEEDYNKWLNEQKEFVAQVPELFINQGNDTFLADNNKK